MITVTLDEAQAKLPEIISQLVPGEELLITRDNHPIAKITAQPRIPCKPRQPGTAKGKLVVLAEDEEHLEDFKDYMP